MELQMKYCVECGTKLTEKYLDRENRTVPYCNHCRTFRFPIYNTAVSMVVYDVINKKYLLIKQYGKPYYRLVAGYIDRGESAEHAVHRELMEETGLTAERISFNKSCFFEPSNTLMINFICYVEHGEQLTPNEEVDSWAWFTEEEAVAEIKPDSLAKHFLCTYLDGTSGK